ncbi:MAG: 2-amino-4-hydroxy-6-hydroxymethyldihydropteridine diphosphokinase [Myxococcota bacterium]
MDPAQPPRATAWVSLGSNLGDRKAHLFAALRALGREPEIEVAAVSRIYETDPVGPAPQRPYLNAAARIETSLAPVALLAVLLRLEADEGRQRSGRRNEARTLDLDLLLYGDRCVEEPGLTVPHPRLHRRAFVLEPLREVAGNRVHPRLGETIDVLARRVRDPEAVRPLDAEVSSSLRDE